MAAIAGAIAQYAGRELMALSEQVIVENGGDVFLKTSSDTTLAIFAGKSPLSMKVGVKNRQPGNPLCPLHLIWHHRAFHKFWQS